MGVPESVQPNNIIPIFWGNQFLCFLEPLKPYLASVREAFRKKNSGYNEFGTKEKGGVRPESLFKTLWNSEKGEGG